jgi:hypothetical protein
MAESIGFLANLSHAGDNQPNIKRHFFDRIVTMSKVLADHGVELLIYSPADIDPPSKTVLGYGVWGEKFVKKTAKIPKINGDWMISTPQLVEDMAKTWGKGYQEFLRWADANAIKLFTPMPCVTFFRDKKKVQEHVAKIANLKQPYTEFFKGDLEQIEAFLKRGSKIFVKPLAGSKSDNIAVITRLGIAITVNLYPYNYHTNGEFKTHKCQNEAEALAIINNFIDDQTYIIQEGIDVLRYKDSPLDIRILMINDGTNWSALHEISIGKAASDISYISSGVKSADTYVILSKIFSPEMAQELIIKALKNASLITNYFSNMFENNIPELAYDFVFDKKGNIYFLEANTKPAFTYPGETLRSKIFEILPEEREIYDQYIIPHATYLAKFFLKKLELEGR